MMRALMVLLGCLTALPCWAQTVWRAATEYPATAMPGQGLANFARLLGEKTGGQVTLVPGYDAPNGLKSAGMPAAVEDGRIEVGDAFAGTLTALGPVFQVSSLPFLATDPDQAARLYRAAKPAYEQAFAAHGQRLLYATPWPNTGIWSRAPIGGAEALRGLPIRTYDATSTQVMRGAGADPVEYSFADVMPHLKDGSVTAVMSSGDGGAGRKLWDYTRHFTEIGYAMPLSLTTVSVRAYEALPAALRGQVDAAAAETETLQFEAVVQRTRQNYVTMRANGVEISAASPGLRAALGAAAAPVVRDWQEKAGAAGDLLRGYTP